MVTFRELPKAEWHRLEAMEPFATEGLPVKPDHWRMVVCEQDDQIIGFCGLYDTVHWEPWWIDPAWRKHPAVVRGLIRQSLGLLTEMGVQITFATVGHDHPETQALMEHLGFVPAPGKLYIIATGEIDVA